MSGADDFRFFQTALTAYDAPAFLRRARDMEATWELLLDRCHKKREILLELPRLWLGTLFASAPSWSQVSSDVCTAEDVVALQELHRQWSPKLRAPVSPTDSPAKIRQLISKLSRSFERFNQRWLKYVSEIDLKPVNKLRDGYNKNYLVEKECAVWSSEVAKQGFEPLPLATIEDLLVKFPLLKVPRVPPMS